MGINKQELIGKIHGIEGLGNEEKSALIELLKTHKKYGLVWEDKPEDVEERLRDELPVLTEVKERAIISEDPDAPTHILIEGDNLEALTALTYTHAGKIDVIYIDPPYNTGNKDFVYNDTFVDSEDSFRHSKWLSFMSKRLKLAKQLMSANGVIFISIDDNEQAQLKLLCDEIFGANNYQATFHIQVRYADKSLTEEKPFKPLMEYVHTYSKNASLFNPNRQTVNYGLDNFCWRIEELSTGTSFFVGKQEVRVFKPSEWTLCRIEGQIDGLKETWITGSIYTKMSYGNVFRSVVEPRVQIDGLGCLYKVIGRGDDGLGYRYYTGPAKSTATKGKMYSGMPLEKKEQFLRGDNPKRALPIITSFDFAPDFGNIRTEGGVPFGSGKKPIKMLKQFIDYSVKKNAIVLDFFAGSGSTAHAVMQLNEEDNGTRSSILVTNNENKICEEVTYKRLSNVIHGYNKVDGLTHNTLRYYKTDFVGRERSSQNMRQLVYAATDLLCIKEDLYNEVKQFGSLKLKSSVTRYFEGKDKRMLVIYNELAVPAIAEEIAKMDFSGKVKIYVFAPGNYAYDDEFYEVQNKVELCALPAAIYNAYQKVLPKRKTKLLDGVQEESEQEENNGELNLYFGEE